MFLHSGRPRPRTNSCAARTPTVRAQLACYSLDVGLSGRTGVEPPLRGVVERTYHSEPKVELREWVMGLGGSPGLEVSCGARTAAEGNGQQTERDLWESSRVVPGQLPRRDRGRVRRPDATASTRAREGECNLPNLSSSQTDPSRAQEKMRQRKTVARHHATLYPMSRPCSNTAGHQAIANMLLRLLSDSGRLLLW